MTDTQLEPTMASRGAAEFFGTFGLVFGGVGTALIAGYLFKPLFDGVKKFA